MKRVQLQPAFVLHTRPIRETSVLVELLTPGYGRITVVARGAKSAKSMFRGILRPWQPMVVSWAGRGSLQNLNQAELSGRPFGFSGRVLIAALYLNELLMRLLQCHDPHEQLYQQYQQSLVALEQAEQQGGQLEPALREFESCLLRELGYGFRLDQDRHGVPIAPDGRYFFYPNKGVERIFQQGVAEPTGFQGQSLLDFANQDWEAVSTRQAAKQLMRLALAPLLGERPLQTRQLLI